MNSIIITNKGKRKVNQDYVLSKEIHPGNYLFLVADGMGGYTHGEIASEIVAENILTYLSTINQVTQEEIQMAVNKANLAIKQYIVDTNEKLGSTLGGVIVNNEEAICFWVGDVKIFMFRDEHLIYESKPHSLINELISNGSLVNDIQVSKYKHIVTRSVQGDRKNSSIGYKELGKIKEEDLLIICSDGVHDIIDGIQIQQILKSSKNIEQSLKKVEDKLLVEANDNYSIIGLY